MHVRTLSAAMIVVMLAFSGLMTGCAHERHEVVPPSATIGAEGEKMLNYTTAGPGTVYVTDTVADKLLYSGEVDGRRQITVDPEKNHILVDGSVVTDKTLVRGHNHKIFFQPRYR